MNIKLVSKQLHCFDIQTVWHPFQVLSMQTFCGFCDPKWSARPEEVCVDGVTSGGIVCYKLRRVAIQNAPFFQVLSYVRHVENLPATFHSREADLYAMRPMKHLMGDPSPLCTQVVKLGRNCSVLGRTLYELLCSHRWCSVLKDRSYLAVESLLVCGLRMDHWLEFIVLMLVTSMWCNAIYCRN